MTAPRILVVDDELANRRLLDAILVDEGYEVVEAADGGEALHAIATQQVDLVLLDVMMPGMSGFDICRRIRTELDLPQLPVVFVTALGDRASRIRGKEVGADDFLTKPVDDVELLVRVKSLLRLKAHHDAREHQRNLMATILDRMSEGVVAVDERAGFMLHNRAAERILGPIAHWAPLATWPGDLEEVGSDGRLEPATREAPLLRAIRGEATTDLVIRIASPTSGRHAYMTLGARPLPGGQGAVAVFRDITSLVELDRFKEEMISLVVHDLKNVMMVIQSSIEYCVEVTLPGDEERQIALRDADAAGRRALRLISNLLDVARLENSELQLSRTPVALATVCHAVTAHRSSQLRARQQTMDVDVGDQTADVDVDLLSRVLENVLDNALRYTPPGGRLSIVATTYGEVVRLAIGNTGPAISTEQRERIFDKYGQLSPSRRTMNVGLGLYFCRLVVAAHGGKMWVEETPELPTVFVIELPAVAGAGVVERRETVALEPDAALLPMATIARVG